MTARERTTRTRVASWCIALVCLAPSLAIAQSPASAEGVASSQGSLEHEVWQLVSGVGVGLAGHPGRQPTVPGAALHFSIGFLLSPVPQIAFGTELDILVTLREHLGETSIPYGGAGLTTNSFGLGATFMVRLLPRSGRFFASGLFRLGMQLYSTGVEDDRPLFTLHQPGLEAGMRWKRAELSLRALFGIPDMYGHSDLYTIMLNVGFRMAGGPSRSR